MGTPPTGTARIQKNLKGETGQYSMVDTAGFPLFALIGAGTAIAAGIALLRLHKHAGNGATLPILEPVLIEIEEE